MVRKPCCSDLGLNKGPWTHDEDLILKNYVETHGEGRWSILPQKAGLQRCGRSCRLRWINYLRPEVKHDNISADEEELIIRLHKLLGNRWSLIASRMPGRTDNQIKNAWYSRLRKKIPKSAGTEDCNIQNPVLRPMPYRPSPNENLLIADRQMVHQQNLDNDNGAVVVSPTANDEQDGINQTGACSDIDEFIAKLPYWAFPQSNVEKYLTPFENFHNSFGNSYNINNIIDQGFCWSSSSTPPMPFSSILRLQVHSTVLATLTWAVTYKTSWTLRDKSLSTPMKFSHLAIAHSKNTQMDIATSDSTEEKACWCARF